MRTQVRPTGLEHERQHASATAISAMPIQGAAAVSRRNHSRALDASSACAHARSDTRSPSSPVGRNTSTTISTRKANTSW